MKEFKHITKSESIEFCGASCDLESGNYLIRKRTQKRLNAIQKILEAERAENPTDRQKEILEWHKVCSDYFYAKKNGYIDDDGKFFDIKWNATKNNVVEKIAICVFVLIMLSIIGYAAFQLFITLLFL